jgi:hypothetical protein
MIPVFCLKIKNDQMGGEGTAFGGKGQRETGIKF